MPDPLHILGRFPPPIDGQTIATRRLADLLEDAYAVRRVSTSPPDTDRTNAAVTLRPGRVRHYLAQRRHLHDALAAAPTAPVLWGSISPMPLGHWRDVLVTQPAFQPGQRVYGVVHWGNFDRVFRAPLTRWTARRLVRRLTGIVFLNELLADRCAPWVPDAKRLVIPNTIDPAVVCSEAEVVAKQGTHAEDRPFRLLFLSNMIASKGYLDVLEAIRLLHTRGVPVRADFVGGWTGEAEQAAFEARVEHASLGAVVTHHGTVSDRARVKAFYRDADVFLLPTYYPTEAQPLSIIEALSAGTPVITTAHASIPAMVREDHEALFVPARAPEAIANAIERLTDAATWQRLSAGARARFETHFSAAAVRRQWLALLADG